MEWKTGLDYSNWTKLFSYLDKFLILFSFLCNNIMSLGECDFVSVYVDGTFSVAQAHPSILYLD